MTRKFPLLLPLLALCLSGCALFESRETRALRRSPDYRAGYSDGCASASSVSANPRANMERRDEGAFDGNRAYRLGWQEGRGACRPMPNVGPAGIELPRS